jgi:hypothetical protein
LNHQADGAANGRILLAFEQGALKGIPLYESRDGGDSFKRVTIVKDQAHHGDSHWQLRAQPNLTELRRDSGPLKKGTLLLAANAIHTDAKGRRVEEDIEVYASTDQGRNWHYRGTIIKGGPPAGPKDNRGVWEPDVHILDDGKMVAYYSSEKHKKQGYNQLLAHKVSTDGGRTWGKEHVDVAVPGGVQRPGMAVVERLPTGHYVMSYENIDGPRNGQVFLKFSRDGLDWGEPSDHGTPVKTAGGTWPERTPVVRWFDRGGPNGVLIVVAGGAGSDGTAGGIGGNSSRHGHDLYWNKDFVHGPWYRVPAPVKKRNGNIHSGWTQGLLFTRDGQLLHVTSSASKKHPDVVKDNDIRYAKKRVSFNRYEAEDGARRHAAAIADDDASNHGFVRVAARPRGRVTFRIRAAKAGSRTLRLRYREMSLHARPVVSVNGARLAPAPDGQKTDGWRTMTVKVRLRAGSNLIGVHGGRHALDFDYMEIAE